MYPPRLLWKHVFPAPTSIFLKPVTSRDHPDDWSASQLELIADSVRPGRRILFLGPGIHASAPPGGPIQYSTDQAPLLGAALSRHLASSLAVQKRFPSEDPGNLSRIAMFYEAARSRHALAHAIADAVQVGKRPSPLLRALAELDFPIVVTTNYDKLFEQALIAAGKQPRVMISSPQERPADGFTDMSVNSPGILKLHGDIEQPDSIVITDDDHIQFALRMNDNPPYDPVPLMLKCYLSDWYTCFWGTACSTTTHGCSSRICAGRSTRHLPRTCTLSMCTQIPYS
jgi:hypothetical protein